MTRTLLSLPVVLALLGCIENPESDPRVGRDRPDIPGEDSPLPPSSTPSVGVPIGEGMVYFNLVKTGEGIWTLAAWNQSGLSTNGAIVLFQAAPPTSLAFGNPNGPDFYVSPVHEEVLIVPELQPRRRTNLREIRIDPFLTAQDPHIKVVLLRQAPDSGSPPFPAAGLYLGEYRLHRGDTLARVGDVRGVVDATGRLGFSLLPTRPATPHAYLLGAYRAGAQEELEYLYVQSGGHPDREVHVSAWQREVDGYSARIPVADGDTAVMRVRRVEAAEE